jgi:hypothetical protein
MLRVHFSDVLIVKRLIHNRLFWRKSALGGAALAAILAETP